MANVSNVNSYDGTPDNDSISGTNGGDSLSGAGGLDTIRGLDGSDILAGGPGNDEIYGGGGDDSISGDAGDDYIEGGFGQNTINGGDGFDTLSYFVSSAPMVINLGGSPFGSATNGGEINDTLVSIESIRGSLFDDAMTGSNTTSETFEGRAGNDFIDGRDGNDRLSFSRATAGVNVDLVAGVSQDEADASNGTTIDAANVGVDTFTNIERVEGSQYDDYLTAVTILENGYLDFGVTPEAGNVSSSRSTYNVIAGGRGNDTIIGNGNTEVNFNFFSAAAGVVVDLKSGTAESTWSGSDKLYGAFSSVVGTKFNDVIQGDNILLGGESFIGLAGNDTFIGGGGYDGINYSASSSAIQVDLEAGNVVGGADVGTDSLSGIEGIIGSGFSDSFEATNFGFFATNTNAPDDGLFNSFEGRGGNDTVLGNGSTRIVVQSNNAGVWINSLEGRAMDLTDYQNGTSLDAAGVGVDTFSGVNSLRGGAYSDVLIGGRREFNQLESYEGRAGNDSIYGGSGYDRVNYRNEARTGGFIDGADGTLLFGYDENGDQIYTTGIDIRMADGIVVGDERFTGTDLLRGIESIRGTVSADSYDATGFNANSANSGSNGFVNDFEGSAGNDTVTGNGHTRIRYSGATAAVYVNLDTNESLDLDDKLIGSTADVAMIGVDILGNGINSIAGSKYSDLLIGGRSANDLIESYDGGQGNDTISGGSGFDRVRYNTSASQTAWLFDGENLKMLEDGLTDSTLKFSQGVTVNLSAGTAVGDANWIGTDTLLGIESVFGTILADSYNAVGFSGTSENAGANGTFNEFQGFAGDDIVIGNGNTRVSYVDAYAGVLVDLENGTSSGLSAGDAAFVGVDTLAGVNAVRGSAFGDELIGSREGDILEGMEGNDSIKGGAGNDRINGGAGRDIAVYEGDLSSVISIGRSADGLSTIIRTTNEGTDTLTNIEGIQFGLAPVMSVQEELLTLRQSPVFSSIRTDLNVVKSDGIESSEESTVVSDDSVVQTVDASSVFLMPDVYTGPVAGIDFQLIDTTPDAVIVGSIYNDFIVLQGTGNKAVDGGGGNNVIDGGTGSTFITGGGTGNSDTFFLDGRAPGTSWSTITDFELGLDKATIWGWKEGVSSVLAVDAEGGATGYTGLTLHFKNLLPDGATETDTNLNLNSITLSGKTLADFGASSLEELNMQIANQTNGHFRVDQTVDQLGDHGYLYIS